MAAASGKVLRGGARARNGDRAGSTQMPPSRTQGGDTDLDSAKLPTELELQESGRNSTALMLREKVADVVIYVDINARLVVSKKSRLLERERTNTSIFLFCGLVRRGGPKERGDLSKDRTTRSQDCQVTRRMIEKNKRRAGPRAQRSDRTGETVFCQKIQPRGTRIAGWHALGNLEPERVRSVNTEQRARLGDAIWWKTPDKHYMGPWVLKRMAGGRPWRRGRRQQKRKEVKTQPHR
ncbi:hypothetical protein K438DRAFT_1791257 [Mycena galopus ATCC 62051]|nr:hypothetical protein K438DRAFT_1791257 [Mycena galopus ATCC 62051]